MYPNGRQEWWGTEPFDDVVERKCVSFEPVRAAQMRVPDNALKAVVYIGALQGVSAKEDFTIAGTGFLVVHNRNPTTARAAFYLITAKHVIANLIGRVPLAIQTNDHRGNPVVVPLPTELSWFCHADEFVDVAVLPWVPPSPEYDCKVFQTSRFATSETLSKKMLGPGDEVFSIGLFNPFANEGPSVPLARIGHVAMLAAQPIPLEKGSMVAHLIDGHSMDGMSGAPVFVRDTVSICTNPNEVKEGKPPEFLVGEGTFSLLGLMHGQWEIPAKVRKQIDPNAILHSAVSAVVPSTKILEVLEQPMVIKQREKARGKLKPTSLELDKEPTQKTRAGIDIPIPTRGQVESVFKKATQKNKP